MVKHQVKVVVRTRPTASFASKHIHIDPVHSVTYHTPILAPGSIVNFVNILIDCEFANSEERKRGFHKQSTRAMEVQIRQNLAQLKSGGCFRCLCSRYCEVSGGWVQWDYFLLWADWCWQNLYYVRLDSELQIQRHHSKGDHSSISRYWKQA